METVTAIISIAALVLSVVALVRTLNTTLQVRRDVREGEAIE